VAEGLVPVSEDALLGGRLRLLQPARGHRAGTDAVLLAAAAPLFEGETAVDVGAATGAVGLMMGEHMRDAHLVFVERDPDLATLCRRNLELNGWARRGRVVQADILSRAALKDAGLLPGSADCVVTNPPFLDPGRSRPSPDHGRAAAHVMSGATLEAWLRACAGLLQSNGRLALIHRADRLADCLSALPAGLGAVHLTLVHPQADRPATRVVLTARKGSRAPLTVQPPVILHEPSGRFTAEAAALHRGERLLAG
jgi:tRNA1(Val) A37 N6-methylase TrmN6